VQIFPLVHRWTYKIQSRIL